MKVLRFVVITIATAAINDNNLVNFRSDSINSTNPQEFHDIALWQNKDRSLEGSRYRKKKRDSEKAFGQIYFGKNIRKLQGNEIKKYEKMMAGIAKNLTQSDASVQCVWISQENVQVRRNRLEIRNNQINHNLLVQNLEECATEKTRSLTVKFYLRWSSTTKNQARKYFKIYMRYMNSHEGRLATALELREMNICAITTKCLKSMPIPMSAFFSQNYTGPSLSRLNSSQIEEYEAYFEGLTDKYTDKPITAACFVIDQTEFSSTNVYGSRKLSESKLVKINYKITWQPNSLVAIDENLEQELITNYINYINQEKSIKKCKLFMNSIDVPVEEASLTTHVVIRLE